MLYLLGGRGHSRGTLEPADGQLRRRAGDDRDRARLADRHLRGPAVLGPHAPACAAADGRAPADPAGRAVAANVARAAAGVRGRDRAYARARPWTAPIRALARPLPACILFNATFVLWHIPCAYNLTLNNNTIHDLEHAMFFFTGLLFWARVIDPGPLRPRLNWPPGRLRVSAMVVGWVIAITLVIVPQPLYAHYATSPTPGRNLRTDRPAARRRGHVGARLTLLHHCAMVGFYNWMEPDTYPGRRPAGAHDLTGDRKEPMPSIPFADNYLAGSLMSLLLPSAAARDRRLVHDRDQEGARGHARVVAVATSARGRRGRATADRRAGVAACRRPQPPDARILMGAGAQVRHV